MRIAIIGKGGSGKSSISWLLVNYFSKSKKVLAIDADYNMDLMHNLGIDNFDEKIFLKNSEKDLYGFFNLDLNKNAFEILENNKNEVFNLDSELIKKYSKQTSDSTRLMVLGDHDEETMYSGRCGHAYAKSIKFLLPYTKTDINEIIIVDSVAGTDMVNYGLFLGVDAIFCVTEDTKNSMLVMQSAKKIADSFNIPFYYVLNKFSGKSTLNVDKDFLPITKFHFDEAFSNYSFEKIKKENLEACKELEDFLNKNIKYEKTISRLENWKIKNTEFKNS